MARKTIFVSDLTGKGIDEKSAATVTIKYADARRGQVVLDVNASEVDDLASKGTKQAGRGRRAKTGASRPQADFGKRVTSDFACHREIYEYRSLGTALRACPLFS